MGGAYELIRAAIEDRRQVEALFDGRPRRFCPHAIGSRAGEPRALVFQIDGYSDRGLPPGGDWRCLAIDRLSDVALADGPWRAREHSQPQTCIDEVDLSIVD
jgi:hypothetical protein